MRLLCCHRYDVYANLEAEAAFLKLNNNGSYLLELQAAFAKLQVMLHSLHVYYNDCQGSFVTELVAEGT